MDRITLALAAFAALTALVPVVAGESVTFRRIQLTDRYYCDGVATGDIDGDGHTDFVAGPFWYAGPDFKASHEFYEAVPLPPEENPSNSMFSFVHDFNADGRLDILVLGRVHKHPAVWYENPGTTGQLWETHFAFERVRGESPSLVDLDGDGTPQLIAHWDGRWGTIEQGKRRLKCWYAKYLREVVEIPSGDSASHSDAVLVVLLFEQA
jgi:hypothetical protein